MLVPIPEKGPDLLHSTGVCGECNGSGDCLIEVNDAVTDRSGQTVEGQSSPNYTFLEPTPRACQKRCMRMAFHEAQEVVENCLLLFRRFSKEAVVLAVRTNTEADQPDVV